MPTVDVAVKVTFAPTQTAAGGILTDTEGSATTVTVAAVVATQLPIVVVKLTRYWAVAVNLPVFNIVLFVPVFTQIEPFHICH